MIFFLCPFYLTISQYLTRKVILDRRQNFQKYLWKWNVCDQCTIQGEQLFSFIRAFIFCLKCVIDKWRAAKLRSDAFILSQGVAIYRIKLFSVFTFLRPWLIHSNFVFHFTTLTLSTISHNNCKYWHNTTPPPLKLNFKQYASGFRDFHRRFCNRHREDILISHKSLFPATPENRKRNFCSFEK